jgi:hypothetical protein
MSRVRVFLDAALKLFDRPGEDRERLSKYYIPVPALLSVGKLPGGRDAKTAPKLTNPFVFLTNKWDKGEVLYQGQGYAADGSISFIVGRAGLGKTELARQVTNYLIQNNAALAEPLEALPVNLALCREEVGNLKADMTPEDYARLLFERIRKETNLDPSFLTSELRPAIYSGKVLLLLDGLDELLSGSKAEQNLHFFSNLSKFLLGGGDTSQGPPKFRVVVGMRIGYMSAVAGQDGSELFRIVNAEVPPGVTIPTYFLHLDLLDDERMKDYINRRLTAGDEALNLIKRKKKLLEMLRRPLMLRIFCDIAKLKGRKKRHLLTDLLKDIEHPSKLIEEFTKQSASDPSLTGDQTNMTSVTWDADKLARRSVKLYEHGRAELGVRDVYKILKETGPAADAGRISVGEHEYEKILDGIHKCPFLMKYLEGGKDISETRVHFTHRSFFEYFVARGHVILKNDGDVTPWMNLVLNVNTRKFLRGMIEPGEWYKLTKRAYALADEDRAQWVKGDEIDFGELERERTKLLDYMTEPDSEEHVQDATGELETTIRGFLDKDYNLRLHPRYLMYNYEAVSLYVEFHCWDERGEVIGDRFSDILNRRLQETDQLLRGEKAIESFDLLRGSFELLLERILNIGYRLRFPWAQAYVKDRGNVIGFIIDDGTQLRVKDIFNNISKAVF